jgi:hypothetical protein
MLVIVAYLFAGDHRFGQKFLQNIEPKIFHTPLVYFSPSKQNL